MRIKSLAKVNSEWRVVNGSYRAPKAHLYGLLTTHNSPLTKKAAFTLAEVLITLGIIGIVAALTMPTLINNHKKRTVSTKLKTTYSILSQAIRLSEVENGEIDGWDFGDISTVEGRKEWFLKYIAPYIKYIDLKTDDRFMYITLANGVIIRFHEESSREMQLKVFTDNNTTNFVQGKNAFGFYIGIPSNNRRFIQNIHTIRPYDFMSNNTEINDDILLNDPIYGCANQNALYHGGYCTLYLMRHGWEITKEYPYFN